MPPLVSPFATAAHQPFHGIYLGAEANGIRIVYVYAWGDVVRREPVRVDQLDDECEELERWLDRKYSGRPELRILK